MSGTDRPYEVAAETLAALLVGPQAWHLAMGEQERDRYRNAARRTVKAFHAERKRQHKAAGGSGRPR